MTVFRSRGGVHGNRISPALPAPGPLVGPGRRTGPVRVGEPDLLWGQYARIRRNSEVSIPLEARGDPALSIDAIAVGRSVVRA